ncbi:MAG: PAS domain S-box protein [Myxococcales bacterium]|nr:PAS domain S-box protein [Myxococcales bacterium]
MLRQQRPVYFAEVGAEFPDDAWLAQVNAQCYLAAPLMDSHGRAIGQLCVTHDAPLPDANELAEQLERVARHAAPALERRRSERTLAEQVWFENAVINEAAEGIAVCHFIPEAPHLRFTVWNERMVELTGYGMAELNQRGWHELAPDAQVLSRALDRVDRLRAGGSVDTEEWTIARADGASRVVQLSVSALRTGSGETHLIGLLQDVTERRERQTELERLKDFHSELVNTTSEGIAIFDSEQRWAYVNPAGAAMLGYTPEELIGLTGADTVMEVDIGVMQAANERRARGLSDRYELVLRHRDGHAVPALVSSVPRVESQTFAGSLSVFTDLSALRRAERERQQLENLLEQSQRLESLGTLAGGIAHDFNNILSIILGVAESATHSLAAGDSIAGDLEEITAAAQRARELVEQVLTFGRRGEERPRQLRLQVLVEEALRMLRQALPSTIELRQHLDPSCPAVAANPTQLHQVIVNLCTNAAHAMRESGGVIQVRLERVELCAEEALVSPDLEAGAFARLTVEDSGVGIAEEVLPRIFEPYFTTKEKTEGTGLGLAVVHGIIKNHHGAIVVESQLGKGSRFAVYLPIPTRASLPPTGPIASAVPRGDERVLCVDDEPLVAKVNARVLRALGYEVTVFTSANDALDALRENPEAFDLLLTDQTMPGMTGTQLAAEARNIDPKLALVVCTGYRRWVDARVASELGLEVLDKPVNRADLAHALRRALDGVTGRGAG